MLLCRLARSLKQLIETVEDLSERGVIRERTLAGLQAARTRGRIGGRPPTLAAKAMLKDPEITVLEVARRLGVTASTLYHHLSRTHTAALEA